MEKQLNSNRFEMLCGIVLSIFASILAATQIGDGHYGSEELKAINEKAQAFQWHQSKGIKQSLVEGQMGLMETLLKSGSIATKDTATFTKNIQKLKKKVERYEKEKNEILNGSAVVGKANWVQDVNGEMGKVIGAKEWEKAAEKYNEIGDKFEMASLFLQLCIVMGGVSLVIQNKNTKRIFFGLMVGLGSIGAIVGLWAVLFFS
jgi:DNA repair exonuclease SbcCD ATPase subunit